MRVECGSCPLRELDCFEPLSPAEAEFMPEFKTGELEVDSGSPIVLQGAKSPHLFTVLTGCATRFKTLDDGRKQVIGFVLPGDFVGLQAGILGEMHHTVEAATPMRLCVFNRSDFYEMFRRIPERGFDVCWLAAREEHFLGDYLLTVGRRTAEERVAFGISSLHRRARAVGLASKSSMEMPFTQQDMADALGLSLVHTNKTLKRLRDRKVISWKGRTISILDHDELLRIGRMDDEPPKRRPLL